MHDFDLIIFYNIILPKSHRMTNLYTNYRVLVVPKLGVGLMYVGRVSLPLAKWLKLTALLIIINRAGCVHVVVQIIGLTPTCMREFRASECALL